MHAMRISRRSRLSYSDARDGREGSLSLVYASNWMLIIPRGMATKSRGSRHGMRQPIASLNLAINHDVFAAMTTNDVDDDAQ